MDECERLLTLWQQGEAAAIGPLLSQVEPFVRQRARHLLGAELRWKVASDDIVQDAVLEFLRYGPRHVPANVSQLRALLARIVANTVCDHGKWFQARRRRMAQDAPLHTTLLAGLSQEDAQPSEVAAQRELAERLLLALDLLPAADRELITWREWEQLPFAEIGQRRGQTEEAARTSVRRALLRLSDTLARLRRGDVDGALEASGDDAKKC
jgi:RNA polymerase sigma factor (sigma-70 family)